MEFGCYVSCIYMVMESGVWMVYEGLLWKGGDVCVMEVRY